MLFKFSFECEKCGQHRVNQATFMQFVPESVRSDIQNRVIDGSDYGIIKFEHACPYCLPKGTSDGEVVILKNKMSAIN